MTLAIGRPLMPLTARQQVVVSYFWDAYQNHQPPPTFRVLCNRLKIASPNGINCHFKALRLKGWLDNAMPGYSNAWQLTPEAIASLGGADPDSVSIALPRDLAERLAAAAGGDLAPAEQVRRLLDRLEAKPVIAKGGGR